MALTEYSEPWNVEAVFEEVWCPCCGCEDFAVMTGGGLWCDRCNLKATVRYPGGDPGYIVEFHATDTLWHDSAEQSIPGSLIAKLLGQRDPSLDYWGTPTRDGDLINAWSPVTRDHAYDGELDARPVRATMELATNPAGQWGGHIGARCDRCENTTYSGVRRHPDDWRTIAVVECTHCAKLFDAEY